MARSEVRGCTCTGPSLPRRPPWPCQRVGLCPRHDHMGASWRRRQRPSMVHREAGAACGHKPQVACGSPTARTGGPRMAVERRKPSIGQTIGPCIWSWGHSERKPAPRLGSLWTHRQGLVARPVVRDPEGRVRGEGVWGRAVCNDPGRRLQVSPCHIWTPRPP